MLFAPHIGVSVDGTLGKYNRKGMAPTPPFQTYHCALRNLSFLEQCSGQPGTVDYACGAACGALIHCIDVYNRNPTNVAQQQLPVIREPGEDLYDFQIDFIKKKVLTLYTANFGADITHPA